MVEGFFSTAYEKLERNYIPGSLFVRKMHRDYDFFSPFSLSISSFLVRYCLFVDMAELFPARGKRIMERWCSNRHKLAAH